MLNFFPLLLTAMIYVIYVAAKQSARQQYRERLRLTPYGVEFQCWNCHKTAKPVCSCPHCHQILCHRCSPDFKHVCIEDRNNPLTSWMIAHENHS